MTTDPTAMPAHSAALLQALRALQLPLAPDREDEALGALMAYAAEAKLDPTDLTIVLTDELGIWASEGKVGKHLKESINRALAFTPPALGAVDGAAYLATYKRLRASSKTSAGLTHALAQRLLSRMALIAHLLANEAFSCTQVARVLYAMEAGLDVPYRSVAVVASTLQLVPELQFTKAVHELADEDTGLASALFPDSDVVESSEIAAELVAAWLPEVDVRGLLVRLSKATAENDELTWPYLQVLHWCLIPIEFYDHPASYLYEFKPRGVAAEALFKLRYAGVATGNPFLNNMKAVATLNSIWARNRGQDDAHALVAILGALEALPFTSRREVARVFRAWLTRVVELRTIEPQPLDTTIDAELFQRVAEFICTNETGTQGVIEQRVVDCLAVLAFNKEGWRPTGLGDGVNASNLSRRKLGDVEFANVNARAALALEAHGGHLSQTYVMEHQRSLRRIVKQRLDESWRSLDDPENWSITVLFVAHSRDRQGLPTTETIHGVPVTYEYIDYRELLRRALAGSDEVQRLDSFSKHVIEVLNRSTVRESARDAFRAIIDA